MPARWAARAIRLALLLTALYVPAAPVRAQAASSVRAAPFLPAGHWAIAAARRLADLGLAPPGFDPGWRALTLDEAARLFAYADRHDASEQEGLARAYAARFEEEFGAWAGTRAGAPRAFTGAASAGYESREGRVLSGVGYSNIDDWTGTVSVPDVRTAAGGLTLDAALGTHFAAGGHGTVRSGGAELDAGQVVARAGRWAFWAGRRTAGYGPGASGIVLSDNTTFDGAGLFLAAPVTLPWVFRHLGPVRFELFGSRVVNGDRITHPWFMGGRVSVSPHPRLVLGLNRGAMFGGDGNAPVTFGNLMRTLVGAHSGPQGEFANQIASVDAWYRPPLGELPLAFYIEYGFDDTSGAYHRSPAIVGGARLGALPGAPAIALGIEYAWFAHSSFKGPDWYRNVWLRGGWTDHRRPLGHPLGGHGSELLVTGAADVAEARLRLEARVFLRDRGSENLFAPERTGSSTGASATARWRARPWLELEGSGSIESGARDWRMSRVTAAARLLF